MQDIFVRRRITASNEIICPDTIFSADVREALTKMALYPDRPWRVAALARLCRLSEPHFYRKFKQATGSTPIDWLRRERINHARRRLLESGDPIKQISEQVGYNDPFFLAEILNVTRAWHRNTIGTSTFARFESLEISRALSLGRSPG